MKKRPWYFAFFPICMVIVLFLEPSLQYYWSPKNAMSVLSNSDNEYVLWYDEDTPVGFFVYLNNEDTSYQFNLTCFKSIKIMNTHLWSTTGFWKVLSRGISVLDTDKPFEGHSCHEIEENIYILWGVTNDVTELNALVGDYSFEVFEISLENQIFYVWYIFGDVSLTSAKILYNEL